MPKRRPATAPFTADDVRLMISSPVYGYCINLQPTERASEAVMQLNTRLAQEMRDTGTVFTSEELDRRFRALLLELEASGNCTRGVDCPPIVSKEQWLQVQLVMIQKLSCDEKL